MHTALDTRSLQGDADRLGGRRGEPLPSVHWFGQQAKGRLSKAREQTARFFNAKPDEILFTSGGTESLKYALRGICQKGHVISTAIEHLAIYKTLQSLEAAGVDVTYLPVGLWGRPSPEQISHAIRPDTCAIALSSANGRPASKSISKRSLRSH